MSNAEVLSAFLDGEPFDRGELAGALEDPEGRRLLFDLLALREIVQPEESIPHLPIPKVPIRFAVRAVFAAAVVTLALTGGYAIGVKRSSASEVQAPAPTRIVEGTTTIAEPVEGGMR